MTKTSLIANTPDVAVGMKINQLLFLQRKTRKELAQALNTSPATAGRKVLGSISWSLSDLFAAADFFNVDVNDLLPRRIEKAPEEETSSGAVVAGAGFEPTTSGLWTYYWFIRNYFFRLKASFLSSYIASFIGCYHACLLACYQWYLQEKRPILCSCLSLKTTGSTRFRWAGKPHSGGSSLHSGRRAAPSAPSTLASGTCVPWHEELTAKDPKPSRPPILSSGVAGKSGRQKQGTPTIPQFACFSVSTWRNQKTLPQSSAACGGRFHRHDPHLIPRSRKLSILHLHARSSFCDSLPSLDFAQWRFQHCDSMTSHVTKPGGQRCAYSEKADRLESSPSLQNWQEKFFQIAPIRGGFSPETLTATYHPDGSENSPQKSFRSRGHSTLFDTGLPPPPTTKAPTI